MLDWIYKELAAILKHIKLFRNLQKIVFFFQLICQTKRDMNKKLEFLLHRIITFYAFFSLSSVNDV